MPEDYQPLPILAPRSGIVQEASSPELPDTAAQDGRNLDLRFDGKKKSMFGTTRILGTLESAATRVFFAYGDRIYYQTGGTVKYLGVGTEIY